MAASGDNIETLIRIESTHLIQNLNELSEDFFSESEDTQKKDAAQQKVQTQVKAYHTFLQPIQSASKDKVKLAVDTLQQTIERLSLQEDEYREFTFWILSRMILDAEQQLNQSFLSTALRQKAFETLIYNLKRHNEDFFTTYTNQETFQWVRVTELLAMALENYYWVCSREQDFAQVVNFFKGLDEGKKRNFCAMVYYTDQQWELPANTPSLSAALIEMGVITLQEIENSLEPFSQPSEGSEDLFDVDDYDADSRKDQSHQHPSADDYHPSASDDKEKEQTDSWGTAPEIDCLSARINDMSPQAQLGAAFFMFAMGALAVTAGALLALVLVHSVIPSLGITAPIAIGGCVAAVACIVSGVALMGAGIKMAENAFTLFKSSDRVEKPSTQPFSCLRHFLC